MYSTMSAPPSSRCSLVIARPNCLNIAFIFSFLSRIAQAFPYEHIPARPA